MSDIPHYFLYGEAKTSGSLNYLHMARLEESLPKHNWEIHPHRHDNLHQLLVLVNGSVLAQVRDKSTEEHGVCVLSIPPKEVHGFVHQQNVQGYIITISQPFLLNLFSDGEREEFPRLFSMPLVAKFEAGSENAGELARSAQRLLEEYHNGAMAQSSMIGAYLKILFVHIHRALAPRENDSQVQDANIAGYERFVALLEKHYQAHWPISRYANELGMSTGRLNRLCLRHSGQKALQIVHERLLAEAKRQLIFTQLSAKEVGYKLGFTDPGYFSRFFSRNCGIAPKQFQKQVRAERGG